MTWPGDVGRAFGRGHPRRGAALGDRGLEEPACAGRAEQGADTGRAGRLAEHGDVIRVAAERADAFAYPFERGDLVEDAGVARARELAVVEIGEMEEAERPEAVVDRHDHDVAVDGKVRAVVPRRIARAPNECAAVNPHHDGSARVVAARCPDVEVEAVFAVRRLGLAHQLRELELGLRGLGGERSRVPGARPRLLPRGRLPAERADRGCRVRDAPEHVHPVTLESFDLAAARLHDRHGSRG